ncbi:MAG: aryl-sulfate sulfotransferase [Bacteroidia bacterium]|nr:aryl-sulfate sulfotransferase [Bacteroidia bacterium]
MTSVKGQNQTIGLFLNTDTSQDGYTLIAPSISTKTFLIDNCGRLVNQWESQFRPGAVAYLLETGQLLRTGSVSGSFSGGGRGGMIELFDWDGELEWSYRFADENQHQHHDVEYLPNGNILVLAWEKIESDDAKTKGIQRNLGNNGIWPDKVVEIKPIGIDSAEIVWEWRIWDHLIQDVDSTLSTYGVISDHPELINMNLDFSGFGNSPDWNHCNAIDYNPELDQIIINSRNFNEFWIIDHSTTTEEAASHSGGRYGKGGDILYRWGNPVNYNRGSVVDQKLSGQHDAHWIEYGSDKGKIIIFNNATDRNYSAIDVVDTQVDENGFYEILPGLPFGPAEVDWSYSRVSGGLDFNAGRVSGASRLPNGNTIICNGEAGRIWEIDENKNTVWDYQNPVSSTQLTQGDNPGGTALFRAYKYPTFYPGLVGKDLTPGLPLELEPLDRECTIFISNLTEIENHNLLVYPNPVLDVVNIKSQNSNEYNLLIIDGKGHIVVNKIVKTGNTSVDMSRLNSGLYLIQARFENAKETFTSKVIKI